MSKSKSKENENPLRVWSPQFDGEPISVKVKGLNRSRLVAWDEFGQPWLYDPDDKTWWML